jgi:MoaA/NifB/PqqE/SkfB family radical SAM enzyme
MWCAWQVTYRCNFRCSFCPYWRERPDEPEVTLEDIRIGADKLARISSLLISIAGGEPTLRNDLPDIVRVLARRHFPFLTTNGWLVTRKLARALWTSGLWGASVSLDYADPDMHDRHRGVRGAHDRALRAIRLLLEERTKKHQRVNMMAVLNHENLDQMEDLLKLSADAGAWFMVQPYCVLKTGDNTFRPAAPCAARLSELRHKYPHFLSNPVFLEQFDAAGNGGVPNCAAGTAFFNIDNYARVAKCVEDRQRPVGSLREHSMDEILSRLRRRNETNRCQACWYNCRGEVEALYTLRGALYSLPTLLRT